MLVSFCMCYSRVHIYEYFLIYLACIFTSIHIFPLSVVGKGWDEERECKKRRMGEEEMANGLLQSDWFLFLLILPNFLIARGFFYVNMKCLFCGKFYGMVMMIKIKIIITLLFYWLCCQGLCGIPLWARNKNYFKFRVAFAIMIIINVTIMIIMVFDNTDRCL